MDVLRELKDIKREPKGSCLSFCTFKLSPEFPAASGTFVFSPHQLTYVVHDADLNKFRSSVNDNKIDMTPVSPREKTKEVLTTNSKNCLARSHGAHRGAGAEFE